MTANNDLRFVGIVAEINQLAAEPSLPPDKQTRLDKLNFALIRSGIPYNIGRNGNIELLTEKETST